MRSNKVLEDLLAHLSKGSKLPPEFTKSALFNDANISVEFIAVPYDKLDGFLKSKIIELEHDIEGFVDGLFKEATGDPVTAAVTGENDCGNDKAAGVNGGTEAVNSHTIVDPEPGWTVGRAVAAQDLMQEVVEEVRRATIKHRNMAGPHEGWAVIFEELDELWDHVKADTGTSSDARKKAIQIAAMAIRYILDLKPGVPV